MAIANGFGASESERDVHNIGEVFSDRIKVGIRALVVALKVW